jgi:hypothetical protein
VLIARRHLIDSLAQELEQGMIRMSRRSRSSIWDAAPLRILNKSLIDLPHDKKAGIGGDLCAMKINADGAVKFRPDGSCLFVTNCAHAAFPPSDEFQP